MRLRRRKPKQQKSSNRSRRCANVSLASSSKPWPITECQIHSRCTYRSCTQCMQSSFATSSFFKCGPTLLYFLSAACCSRTLLVSLAVGNSGWTLETAFVLEGRIALHNGQFSAFLVQVHTVWNALRAVVKLVFCIALFVWIVDLHTWLRIQDSDADSWHVKHPNWARRCVADTEVEIVSPFPLRESKISSMHPIAHSTLSSFSLRMFVSLFRSNDTRAVNFTLTCTITSH